MSLVGVVDEARLLDEVLGRRPDLDRKAYGNNKRLLFALQLHQGIDDIHSVAAESLTDGGDDKTVDLVHIDPNSGLMIIAQGYTTKRAVTPEKSAGEQKVRDLNTSIAWLLAGKPELLPARLRPVGRAVHQAFEDGTVKEVQFWYVHNLPESVHAQAELDATARMAADRLRQTYEDHAPERVLGVEVGVRTLHRWYEGSRSPILVTQDIRLIVDDYFEISNGKWHAVCTAVDAAWLQGLYWEHNNDGENRLFSANVRGFVGVKGRKGAINSAIRRTVQEQPENLFVLNNGITALTRKVKVAEEPDSDGRRQINLEGLSIVNGAQTTGAVSDETLRGQTESAQVMIRFVVCDEPSLVEEVIRTTNRQLATQPADFRSNDRTQLRLVRDFREELGGIVYDGGRRTAPNEITKATPANRVFAVTAAKALAAFHGEPFVAHNDTGRIWSPEHSLYARLFGEHTTARHILFCYSLQRAVEHAKADFAGKCAKDPKLSGPIRDVHDFFQTRGSIPLVISAVADCMEIILGRGVTDPFALEFPRRPQIPTTIKHWGRVLEPVMPFVTKLSPVLGRRATQGDAGDYDRAKAFSDARKDFAQTVYAQTMHDHAKIAFARFRQVLGE